MIYAGWGASAKGPSYQRSWTDHSRLGCSSCLAHAVLVPADIGHAYPATVRPPCLGCVGGCRIASFGHRWASDVAELAGADLRLLQLPCSCFFPPDYAGPRYGIGYDWYHLLVSLWPSVWLLLWMSSGLYRPVPHLSAVASRFTLH